MKYILILFTFALLVSSCKEEKPNSSTTNRNDSRRIRNFVTSSSIIPVFNTNMEEFQLRGSHARLIRTEKGTRIHIPNKAFVNKSTGEPIEGDVALMVDELITKGEILASGIPLLYTSPEGDTVNLENVGMFDIRAFQDGTELELAEGKEIEIELASDSDVVSAFYAFDEAKENWELKESECVPIVNPYIAKQEMELEKLELEMPPTPKELIEYKSGDHLFDVKRYGTEDEELEDLEGVFWKFTGDSTQIDPSKNNLVFNKNYEFVKLIPVDSSEVREYDMIFRIRNQEVVLRAAPIFQGKLLIRENDRMERVMNQIEYATRSKTRIELQLESEKPMMRMMNIERMGIYTYSQPVESEENLSFIAEFKFAGKAVNQKASIYLLPIDKNYLVKHTLWTSQSVKINPKESYGMIGVSEDNLVYILTADAFRDLKLSSKKSRDTVRFDLVKHAYPIENATELDELIELL